MRTAMMSAVMVCFGLATAANPACASHARGHYRAATFAYSWGPDYAYYRYRYYRNFVPPAYGRYEFDLVAAPYSCCGFGTTTFYSVSYGSPQISAGRPAGVYYRSRRPSW
jgi:hypothetical protein